MKTEQQILNEFALLQARMESFGFDIDKEDSIPGGWLEARDLAYGLAWILDMVDETPSEMWDREVKPHLGEE